MSHTFQASDEQYAYLLAYTEAIGETPETFFQLWVQGIVDWMEVQKAVLREQQERKSHETESSQLFSERSHR